jgi:1-acyl-sn-glycerol-3-phosphate acyltransferase
MTADPAVRSARLRLACLWLSQAARILADNCLRMFVVLEVGRGGGVADQVAWHQVTLFFILPFLVLAPAHGALSNAFPRGRVLAGAAGFSLTVIALLTILLGRHADSGQWCLGLMVVMVSGALYSATRYAMLPAAAEATHIPLPRVNGWIEMGGAAAVVLGLVLGTRPEIAFPTAVVTLSVVSLVFALPVGFPCDVLRPEPLRRALGGFFADSGRVLRDRDARGAMVAVASFLALVVVGTGAILGHTGMLRADADRGALALAMMLVSGGVALGSFLASLEGHPRRALGLVPLGATGMLAALGWAVLSGTLLGPAVLLGVAAGLVNAPLRAAYQAAVPADARGNGMAVSNFANYLLMAALSLGLFAVAYLTELGTAGQLALLVGLAALGAALAWRVHFRDSFELLLELLMVPMYRIRAHGPGLDQVPPRGPLLVIANHTAWLDPMWLAKVLPRRLFPMMTSEFYDLPVIRILMRRVFEAIRVQASGFRREAPELQKAISRLDKGGCVTIFPEGRMRRVPEVSVRMFGRGVWHILNARPKTPVIVCWIEGGWGCYFSYCNGKPTVNKRFDRRRPIDVAVSEPQQLAPEVLADPRATRVYLMRECLQARAILGLEVPPLPELVEDEGLEKAEVKNGEGAPEREE